MLSNMLRLISNYPISRRLIVAFALAAILPSVMIAIMGTYYVNQLNSRRDASSMVANAQSGANNLSTTLHHMYTQTKVLESQVLSGLISPDSVSHTTIRSTLDNTAKQTMQDEDQFQTQIGNYQNQYDPIQSAGMQPVMEVLDNVAATDNTPEMESNLLHTIATDSWPKYYQAQVSEVALLQQIVDSPKLFTTSSAVAQIASHANTLDTTYTAVNGNWNQLISDISGISNHINGVDTNEAQPIIVGTVGAFLLTLIIVTVAGFLVQRSITGPLTELVSLTRQISRGDTHARARINSHDEISIVATSMNSMLDNIVHLIQDTQAQRDVLQGQVEKLVSEVSGVGEGDLRVSAEVTADALGVLADSFNYMVEELGSLVVRVKTVAREVKESTTMTSDRMNELVETADRQIQGIANAATEIERVAMISKQVADRAMALASSAREARINAQGGRQAVQQTIEGMERIQSNVQETSSKVQTLGERSREINNIVEAISNIAHLTNRLALDAAIQAAMAGENGKGFGAVAADIRRLAERAKEQATSVGRIVRSVRDDIGAVAVAMRDTERETSAGSQLAAEAGTSLESIFSVIERQAREIEIINQMTMQQQESSSEVVQIMQSVSESTQASTASTRDAAQNMERVARLAEQLLSSVEAFKLRESLNYTVPSGSLPPLGSENQDVQFAANNLFRMVTSTIQPVSNGGVYTPTPPTSQEESFPQFSPSFAAPPYTQGSNPGQFSFLPPGNDQQPFPLPNGQQPFPAQGGQQPFPPQANRATGMPQWPAPDDWQAGNWRQSNGQN